MFSKAWPETRYTSNDVRRTPMLHSLAEEYAAVYEGSFPPLAEARDILDEGGSLTIDHARTVLNCARYDYEWARANLPVPDPAPRRQPKAKPLAKRSCGLAEGHYAHWVRPSTGEPFSCPGAPFSVNRSTFWLGAKVKAPYVRARTGTLVHRAQPEAKVRWVVPEHHMGPGYPELQVRTECKFPRTIAPAFLIREFDEEFLETHEVRPCHRCFPPETDEENERHPLWGT